MEKIKDTILSEAIQSYLEAEIKISKLKISVVILGTICIIEALLLILR